MRGKLDTHRFSIGKNCLVYQWGKKLLLIPTPQRQMVRPLKEREKKGKKRKRKKEG